MVSVVLFDNKKFISVKDASTLTGYSKDYIGQLCRLDRIETKRIGRSWFVSEESLLLYKNTPTEYDFSKNFHIPPKDEDKNLAIPKKSLKEALGDDIKPIRSTPVYFERKKISPFSSNVGKFGSLLVSLVLVFGLAMFLNGGSFKKNISISGVVSSISTLPKEMKSVALELSDFYSSEAEEFYFNLGPVAEKVLNSGLQSIKAFAKNPSSFISQSAKKLAIEEHDTLNSVATYFSNVVREAHLKTFAFISDALGGDFLKENTLGLTSSVAEAVGQGLNPVDHAGLVVYHTINNWIENGIYSPIARLLGEQPAIINTTYVVTRQKEAESIPSSRPSSGTATERIIERQMASSAGVSREELERRL